MWWEIFQLAGFWISGLCFGFVFAHLYLTWQSNKPKKDPLKLWKKLYSIITKGVPQTVWYELYTPIVIPKENLARILDDLEPLYKKNLEAEQQKDDYWWKVQKDRNRALSKYPVEDLFAIRTQADNI